MNLVLCNRLDIQNGMDGKYCQVPEKIKLFFIIDKKYTLHVRYRNPQIPRSLDIQIHSSLDPYLDPQILTSPDSYTYITQRISIKKYL